MGTHSPPQNGRSSQYSALVYCHQTAPWIKMPLGTQVGLSLREKPTRHCVRWEPSSPPLRGTAPQLSANVRCGQTAGRMKTPLGTEVDLGRGHIVLDGFQLLLSSCMFWMSLIIVYAFVAVNLHSLCMYDWVNRSNLLFSVQFILRSIFKDLLLFVAWL